MRPVVRSVGPAKSRLRRLRPAISICARSGRRWCASGAGSSFRRCWPPCSRSPPSISSRPRYKSEARILIDGRENVFLRPNGERNEERTALDAEAVTSQVQLVLSRDLAREIIKKNKLAERPEFDPVLQGISPLKSLLALFGIGRDPFSLTPEERVLDAYYERLTAYAVDKSRVIVIEFQSRDPELAARVANSIADGYLVLQQNARQEQAKSAGPVAVGRDRQSAQEGRGRRSPASRISAPNRACSSAPTTPRCPTSRWAN